MIQKSRQTDTDIDTERNTEGERRTNHKNIDTYKKKKCTNRYVQLKPVTHTHKMREGGKKRWQLGK